MKKYVIGSLFCCFFLMYPMSVLAWYAQYFLYNHLQWAPDSQSIVFKAECFSLDGGCGGDVIFQYDISAQRLINLTPKIDWYMFSPSQTWLVFADYHGVYLLQLDQNGLPVGAPAHVNFSPFFEYSGRWIFVGFSPNESTFLYGYHGKYYEVTLPVTLAQTGQSFVRTEISDDFSCAEYTSYARHYEVSQSQVLSQGEWVPETDKCQNAGNTEMTSLPEITDIQVSFVPDWVSWTLPQQPCMFDLVMGSERQQSGTSYAIQFAEGEEKLAYERLREYAEYLDGLGLNIRLEHHIPRKQFLLRWGTFATRSAAETAQSCLQQQFQLNGRIVEQKDLMNEDGTTAVRNHPLKSVSRILSPDKTKTAYIKNVWHLSFPEPLTEIWIIYHGYYYENHEVKEVDSFANCCGE